jgi:hypothetical protein
VSVTPAGFTNPITVPKYCSLDSAETQYSNFSAVPYGAEGYSLIALGAANAALSAEPDVFTIGTLTDTLAGADVTALDTYLATANVPSDWVTSGMTWAAAARQIAQIHLVAQAIFGSQGSPIFTGGVTLATQLGSVSTGGLAAVNGTGVVSKGLGVEDVGGGGGGPAPVKTSFGVFSFANVLSTTSVGGALVQVSAQFTDLILFGGGAL